MPPVVMPQDVRTALALMECEAARSWTLATLAAACGVAPRTLQKHFRHFVGEPPLRVLSCHRFEQARRALLRAGPGESVTEIASRCGFAHLGRFAVRYHQRYGETPSATLRRRGAACQHVAAVSPACRRIDRPTLAVLPFEAAAGMEACAAAMADDISVALVRLRSLVLTARTYGRYHLHGRVHADTSGRVRMTLMLTEAASGRRVWADRWNQIDGDVFAASEHLCARIARAVEPSIRAAEMERAWRSDHAALNAWELTMRALSCALSLEAKSENMALDLLDEAMAAAAQDPLPPALASWCHGLRAGHHFTSDEDEARKAARALATRAAALGIADPLAETFLAAGYTLAHDLAAAAVHGERALILDGGSAWAWGRSGWIAAYRGETRDAIERFHIARSLAPTDSLGFLHAIGIGSAHLEAGEYGDAIHWYERALMERPNAIWNDRFRAAGYALAGRKEEAAATLTRFKRAFPDLTIAQIRTGLPHTGAFLDRVSEGLESAGMRA
jgi:AraC-like DNA-binding protein/tetratricopeptide (TPR) repeat protein